MHSSVTKKRSNGCPAQCAPDAERQQSSGVITKSARDARVLEWLIAQVGEDAVVAACGRLSGNRRAYVSNLAKILNLSPPADLSLTPREDAAKRVAALRQMLRVGNK